MRDHGWSWSQTTVVGEAERFVSGNYRKQLGRAKEQEGSQMFRMFTGEERRGEEMKHKKLPNRLT